MRQFILLCLFIYSVKALDGSHDDALIETKDGPKSSHDLIKEVKEEHAKGIGASPLPSPDVVPSDAVQVAGVPSETSAGRPIVLDKPNIVPTTVPEKTGLPSENIAPANSKAEKIALAPSEITTAAPKGESSYTTKVPIESVAVAKKKPGEDKAEVATATKLNVKEIEGSPSDANLPTISPPRRARRGADKSSEESGEEKKEGEVVAVKVPTEEIAVAHKKAGEETEIATATKASIIAAVSEKSKRARRAPDSSSSESHEIHTAFVPSPVVANPGLPTLNVAPNPPAALGGLRIRRDASSDFDENDKDAKSDAFTTKVPTESVAVAKKEPGEDSIKVGTATKVESIAVTGSPEKANLPTISSRVRRDDSKSSEEEKDSSFTTKVPIESVAVAKKKPGEDKAEVATATKIKNVEVSGDPNEKGLPTISPGRARRAADKSSEESGEEKKEGEVVAVKVPTEEIAVAHKKAGEETEIATATKASIIAAVSENPEKKESRVRRHSEPNSKSNESGEEESAQSPASAVINKDQIKESAAIARIKPGESEPEVVAVAKTGIRARRDEKKVHKAGPNESDMAAGDPVKLEAKPQSRARRYV